MRICVLAWAVLGGLLTPVAVRAAQVLPSPVPPAPPAPSPAHASPSPAPASQPRVYVFTLLRKGPAWTAAETPEVRALQEKHLANIGRLGREGKLAAAGPCGAGDLRGVFVFATDSLDEARAWGATDPAVQAGRLRLEPYRLMSTAGIGRRVSEEAAKVGGKTEMIEYQLALVRRGPRFDPREVNENRALFAARNAWLEQLLEGGKLALSGPFLEAADALGVLVLRAGSLEAARALLQGDPAVKTERVAFELEPWWLAKGTLE